MGVCTGVGLLDWMSFKNPFQPNVCYNSVKLNPNLRLMMSRSWTCLPGTCVPQGWGLTSCHLQLINPSNIPMPIPVPVTDSAAFCCSGTAVCSKYDWNILENLVWWKGYRSHTWIHYLNSISTLQHPAAFALAAWMQGCRATWRDCPSLQLASLVIANVLEGCKIIRSVDQACKKLYECCLQEIEINHLTHP